MAEKLKYIRSFDGFRALFCVLIVWQHLHFKTLNVPFAAAWPTLQGFFMLSGFLIVKILLFEVSEKPSFKPFMKRFYRRRIYRIFPLYFVFLFFLIAVAIIFKNTVFVQKSLLLPELKQNWWMLFTYTYNFKEIFNLLMDQPYMISPITVHLWSLSVEEQFYLLIPFLVYFLPKKHLVKSLVFIVVGVQILRVVTHYYMINYTDIPHDALIYILHRNIFFQIDSLAIGGLIASTKLANIKNARTYFWSTFVFCLALTIGVAYNSSLHTEFSMKQLMNSHTFLLYGGQVYYMYFLVNIVIMFLIITGAQSKPVLRGLFESKIMVFLGKISYGMYVFQFFVFFMVASVMYKFNPNFEFRGGLLKESVLLVIVFSVLILLSWLSFKYLETPFLRLKYRGENNKPSAEE